MHVDFASALYRPSPPIGLIFFPMQPAAMQRALEEGDIILSVNNVELQGRSVPAASQVLSRTYDSMHFTTPCNLHHGPETLHPAPRLQALALTLHLTEATASQLGLKCCSLSL